MDLIVVYLLYLSLLPKAINTEATEIADPGAFASAQRRTRPTRKTASVDYRQFSHLTQPHQLECKTCHQFPSKNWKEIRKGDEGFPDVTEYPEHQGCLSCHRSQFFARQRPVPYICSNCHVKATPRDTSRYPFPSVGEKFLTSDKAKGFVSDFRVYFPHDKHLDVISKRQDDWRNKSVVREGPMAAISFRENSQPKSGRHLESDPKSCETCHQTYRPQEKSDDEFVTKPPKDIGDNFWLKKGTFKTRPITHSTCFTCHNQESELAPLPPDCNACHKLPTPSKLATDFDSALNTKIGITDWVMVTTWRARLSAGAFRHEVHPDLSCTKCHNPTMNTVDVKTLKVAVKSCGGAEGCHITATSDDGGILNYEIDQRKKDPKFVCTKCHVAFGKESVPATHYESIPKPAK